jgi:hypothetical protein
VVRVALSWGTWDRNERGFGRRAGMGAYASIHERRKFNILLNMRQVMRLVRVLLPNARSYWSKRREAIRACFRASVLPCCALAILRLSSVASNLRFVKWSIYILPKKVRSLVPVPGPVRELWRRDFVGFFLTIVGA